VNLLRRHFLHLAATAATSLALPSPLAWAATEYPARPVRLVVGFAAGGGNDIIARLIGQWLSERLGQPFVIENRPGAGTNIATEAVVRARPDGYSLLLIGAPNSISATLYKNLSFDFVHDITPVASIAREPYVMVLNPSVPAKTIPEFIALAKANPGKLNMASAGVGSGTQISGELFKMMAGVNLVHVPYRGAGPAMTDLLGGQVQVFFSTMPACVQYIRTGNLRALAVTTAKRSDALPNVPTVGEFLIGYEASGWYGIGAPKNTPAEIVEKLNKEINASLAEPKLITSLNDLGANAFANSPADFGRFIADQTEKWGNVIRTANLHAD
jgi:tripartite-type tricarboxylate transporter receptor subunit TctC